MEFFNTAKMVRLRSHLNKFLYANEDEESVILNPHKEASCQNASWTVEFNDNKVLLKSCYGKYLTASYRSCCLMGMITGLNAVHTEAEVVCSSWVEWEPIRQGHLVKLRTRYGNFLRANDGGIPPWRNSVTHEVMPRKAKQDWILWDVDVLEILRSMSPELQAGAESELDSYPEMYESDSDLYPESRASPLGWTVKCDPIQHDLWYLNNAVFDLPNVTTS